MNHAGSSIVAFFPSHGIRAVAERLHAGVSLNTQRAEQHTEHIGPTVSSHSS
jgi:hypothetical protein